MPIFRDDVIARLNKHFAHRDCALDFDVSQLVGWESCLLAARVYLVTKKKVSAPDTSSSGPSTTLPAMQSNNANSDSDDEFVE